MKTISRRYQIGTMKDGNFQADTLGNDPELTTHDTLTAAAANLGLTVVCITAGGGTVDDPVVWDSYKDRVAFRLEEDEA